MTARANALLRDALWEASQTSKQTDDVFREGLRKILFDGAGDTLADSLIAFAGGDAERRAAFTNLIGRAARTFAPNADPPRAGEADVAWKNLIAILDTLQGSGAHALGRLDFISSDLFEYLVAEAREQRPADSGSRRSTAPAGDGLAALAVSRQLSEAVDAALGFSVEPTGDAVYEFDPPNSHVNIHVDSRDYEFVYHLLHEHRRDGRAVASELIAHLPDHESPARLLLNVGESLVLRGRGTLHSWKPLGPDEHRMLIAVGFAR